MNDEPKFEFDPLPGEMPRDPVKAAQVEALLTPPVERKKRGPKKGAKRVAKTMESEQPPAPKRPAIVPILDQYQLIRFFADITAEERKRVLGILNKVFGD